MDEYILPDDVKLRALKIWDENREKPLGLKEFTNLAFGREVDSRSVEGRALRSFLADKDIKLRPAHEYVKKDTIELTEEQKEFVINNAKEGSSYLEITKILFDDDKIMPRDQRAMAIFNYIKEINPKILEKEDIPTDSKYKPPVTVQQAAARVNKYILDCIKTDDIKNSKIQKNLVFLIRFCHLNRFQSQCNNLPTESQRALFEGSYVRYVYDKPDLTEEELDLYINLCNGLVDNLNMRAEMDELQKLFKGCSDDSEGKRISMSIVESISNVRKHIDENEKRQKALVDTLQGKRNERIDLRNKQDASLIQLLDFIKNYENRQQTLLLIDVRNKKIKEEIKRLESIDDLKFQIYGVDPSEIV